MRVKWCSALQTISDSGPHPLLTAMTCTEAAKYLSSGLCEG